ncbi:MAG: hypothetical protein IPO07_26515 [Haliscomenobacter sp.]|nr:hypothetical protein [Haliscomenobacter sp.]MBK9491956.1 hypothetical protein [Haliscomenobacter sp.]
MRTYAGYFVLGSFAVVAPRFGKWASLSSSAGNASCSSLQRDEHVNPFSRRGVFGTGLYTPTFFSFARRKLAISFCKN